MTQSPLDNSEEPGVPKTDLSPEDILKEWTLGAKAIKIETPTATRVGTIPLDRATAFIQVLGQEKDLDPKEVLLVLTYLFQRGATTKGCNPEEAIVFKGQRISVKSLRTALSKTGLRNKARQVARTLSPQILEIAIEHQIPGNLSRAIGKRHDVKDSDKPYLSDYFLPELIKPDIQKLIEEHLQIRRRK